MARILAVGNATLDIINVVETYPNEDDEVRASTQYRRRGGNTANSLVALAQLGHHTAFAGTLADEPDADSIRDDLQRYGIDLSHVHTVGNGKVPTSYVALSRATGSRTIVHYRDLPEYGPDEFARIDLTGYDWLHFEGRNLKQVAAMMARARRDAPAVRISLEAEKPRPGMDGLFPSADVLLFSRVFANHHGYDSAEDFLSTFHARHPQAILACGWGSHGAYAVDSDGQVLFVKSFAPERVVDTLGAGDVFNAGIIDGLVSNRPLAQTLTRAARLAGYKCGIDGMDGIAAALDV